MKLEINDELFHEIGREISSDTSPVGIDAKKTHIIILQKLLDIQERLERIESKMV